MKIDKHILAETGEQFMEQVEKAFADGYKYVTGSSHLHMSPYSCYFEKATAGEGEKQIEEQNKQAQPSQAKEKTTEAETKKVKTRAKKATGKKTKKD